jgi:phosphoenolpyruvate synthase/pyruvate phosphate dikinase
MVTKIYRRFAQNYAVYKMEYILAEIGKRAKLSLTDVRFMTPQEVKSFLLGGKINRAEVLKRKKFCVCHMEKSKVLILTGNQAKELAKRTETKVKKISEIKGQTGCIGKAQGRVKIIFRPQDMVKMHQGDILVSIATDPDIVPAMKKASAIVTEQGGVTSHAAIVSRELNIPCVIGTKIATKVFKDGDLVEVDATRGIVKKL